MPDNHRIVFKSQWDEEPETNPGDLIFVIRTSPHDIFTRHHHDLRMSLEISLLESLVGFSKEVTHLDGHIVTITNDQVTIPGIIISFIYNNFGGSFSLSDRANFVQ
jgi:DnaJ-class molecular chaperone